MSGAASRRVETVLVAIAWASFVLAVSALVLTVPSFTSATVDLIGSHEGAGLPKEDTIELAEAVRHFVTSERAPALPATYAGREAFDARSVEHLEDVRGVLLGARRLTGILAAGLAVWLAWSLAASRRGPVARSIEAGGWTGAGIMLAGLIVSTFGFDAVFDGFHQVFFEAGTWTFPADSLMIQLFPEDFWMISAAAWVALAVFASFVLVAVGRRLRVRAGAERGRTG